MPAPSFTAYVDESGDEGFAPGSSDWFVLAAAILRAPEELSQVKLIDEVRDALNQRRQPKHRIPDKKPLHFRDLSHDARKLYADRIGRADLRTVAVLIHKPDLQAPETFTEGNRLYFYATRLLLERVSWYCRDHRRKEDPGDGTVRVILSNRSSMNYAALRDSLEYLETNRTALQYRAAAHVLRPNLVETYSHGRRMGLQLADAVASSYFYAVEPSGYGFTEEAYARLILGRAYRHKGQLWGYGLKLMPAEAESRRRTGGLLPGW